VKDLVVLAADVSIEATLRGLLGRPKAIGIRPLQFDSHAHPRRDPGCYREAHEFLAPLRDQYRHALVVFDRNGSGSTEPPEVIEEQVRGLFDASGWNGRADVVVIDPELEVWVWSDSPKVDEALFWAGREPALRAWVRSRGLWPDGRPKPVDPKRAVQLALEEVRIPLSSSVFSRLAATVSFERCVDPAFGRLRERLRAWFPAT
jgi:hypothetical protein